MEKQTTRGQAAPTPTEPAATPTWWTRRHASRWNRVKDALRRDWEQTKADLGPMATGNLDQRIGDTVRQAIGSEPLPTPSQKTRHVRPADLAREAAKESRARDDADARITSTQIALAADSARADGEIAAEQLAARGRIQHEQAKLEDIVDDARREVDESEQRALGRSAKRHEKIAEIQAESDEKILAMQREAGDRIVRAPAWARIEPAVRFGYGARLHYSGLSTWDHAIEARLREEWAQLTCGSPWEEARVHVRRGWESADVGGIMRH